MSTITHAMNLFPRLTQYLVSTNVFEKQNLIVIDAGAKGGFEKHWDWYGPQVKLIGFEPNIEEYEKLTKSKTPSNHTYFPVALSDSKGSQILRVYSYASATSFLRPNFQFLERLPDYKNFIFKHGFSVPTDTVDSIVWSLEIQGVDFMKLDTQGTELSILKGSKESLSSVLGLNTEVAFNSFYEGETTFTDVDNFLKPFGFVLFDLPTFRYARTILSPYRDAGIPHHTSSGQICWGDALYLRDAVHEIQNVETRKLWNPIRLLKLASIMELFSLQDCAAELIEVATSAGYFTSAEESEMIKFLCGERD